MKKLILSVLAIATLSFTSCNNDDENEKKSSFTVTPDALKGDIEKGTVTLKSDVVYKLTGPLVVKGGAKLIIPAGTRIEATGGTAAYIAVSKDAKIYINGTKEKPVVMTSGNAVKKAKDWGGLVICGDAPTNVGSDATSEVGGLRYGGTNVTDSSGSITYLRVEYTGAEYSGSKQFNGVSLFAVGSGTTFEHVSSVDGFDDGIEFFGGTVNAKYLVSINSGDDSIDFADGYTGTLENLYIKGVTKAGIEGSNNGDNPEATPLTTATIKNVSIIDGGLGASEGAIYFKDGGGKITYQNIYVDGLSLAVKVKNLADDKVANDRIANGELIINPIQFVNNKEGFKFFSLEENPEGVIIEANNNGAGNGAELPTWAEGWATK